VSAPRDPPRMGPRPLPLHLGMAATALLGGLAATPTDGFAEAADEAQRAFYELLAGIRAYWAHPYRRAVAEPAVLWRGGSARLLDYGGAGRPVLFVPSLVNRAYILDLAPGRSLVRHLAARGLRPLLLDWGAPGPEERGFDLDGTIARRLIPAFDAAVAATGGPIGLCGYCMGGLLALALARDRTEAISALAFMAVPWDFHVDSALAVRAAALLGEALDDSPGVPGEAPVDLLQAFFAMVQPEQVAAKFRAFAALPQDGDRARDFVALEDWLNDGVPLGAPVARDCLTGWYGANRPARGEWNVAGRPVHPAAIDLPALVMIPKRDRIVPRASAAALATALANATVREIDAGHIGMAVGRRARDEVWEPLVEWFGGGG